MPNAKEGAKDEVKGLRKPNTYNVGFIDKTGTKFYVDVAAWTLLDAADNFGDDRELVSVVLAERGEDDC